VHKFSRNCRSILKERSARDVTGSKLLTKFRRPSDLTLGICSSLH